MHLICSPRAVFGSNPVGPLITIPVFQMIGYRAVLTPGSERYVHHMMLYECHDDRGSSYSRFNHHVNSGYECHAPNMPMDFKVCTSFVKTYKI